MNIAVITSMDQKYYDRCGQNLIESYKDYWSNDFPLFVYNEGEFKLTESFVTNMGWDLGDDYVAFQNTHKNNRVKTFAKKGFSIIHAMNNINCDRLVWLDADTRIKDSFAKEILEQVTLENILSSHFSVWHEKNGVRYHSCETGFFVLNKRHKGFKDFCNTYQDIYVNNKTEGLRRFYDGEVYGKTVELMEEKGYDMLNLNTGNHKTPMPRSIVKDIIEHHKAGLKDRA